ncbi:hypothetical protein D3C87_716130 [compost metagenome]
MAEGLVNVILNTPFIKPFSFTFVPAVILATALSLSAITTVAGLVPMATSAPTTLLKPTVNDSEFSIR